jgi:hypothetical protein
MVQARYFKLRLQLLGNPTFVMQLQTNLGSTLKVLVTTRYLLMNGDQLDQLGNKAEGLESASNVQHDSRESHLLSTVQRNIAGYEQKPSLTIEYQKSQFRVLNLTTTTS